MPKIIQIVFLVLAFDVSAYANEIKLECKVSVETQSNNKKLDKQNSVVFIRISEQDSFSPKSKFIFVNSDFNRLNLAFSNISSRLIRVEDRSDKNNWYLMNMLGGNDNNMEKTEIEIDRNTGFIKIYIGKFYANNSHVLNAIGVCEKVDTSIRKF